MVDISTDGTTVTTSSDFTALAAQYGAATPPNTPDRNSAGTTNYPACPAQNATFLASTTLPPTPNDAACQCLENTLSCQFTPQTSNFTAIVGELLDTGCGLLGSSGGNCNDIAGDGATGSYGRVSFCDPSTKLSFVFTQYYQANNRNSQSCGFGGNATVNPSAPSDVSSANAAATACFASASSVFTPTAPASGSNGSPNTASSSGKSSGAVPLVGDAKAVWGMAVMVVMTVASGVWILA